MSKLFNQLGLPPVLETAVTALGYETPTPVQAAAIPILLNGQNLRAQAQTGTGKTAAFALPILAKIDLELQAPQALVMVPTRELALQVAEAFQGYARSLDGFYVTSITGGQGYVTQLRALKRGSHVIVATPGRAIDHLTRKTLQTKHLRTVILDEADEMLKMGFKEDIQTILKEINHQYQLGLFSATFPKAIQPITERYLKNAEKIHIKANQLNINAIEQFYIHTDENQKFNVLARLLEIEDIEGGIIFARTKTKSAELADKLKARGHQVAALNGDMPQPMRQQVLNQFKRGGLDLVVATDVAARGIDVDRVTHVINYDIPHDTEYYTHRIGRTGRAGRSGKAYLLVTSRQQRFLRDIERVTKKAINKAEPPSIKAMKAKRLKKITRTLAELIADETKLSAHREMLSDFIEQSSCSALDIAAAFAYLSEQNNPLPLENIAAPKATTAKPKRSRDSRKQRPHHTTSKDSRKRRAQGTAKDKRKRPPHSSGKDSRKRPTQGNHKDSRKRKAGHANHTKVQSAIKNTPKKKASKKFNKRKQTANV